MPRKVKFFSVPYQLLLTREMTDAMRAQATKQRIDTSTFIRRCIAAGIPGGMEDKFIFATRGRPAEKTESRRQADSNAKTQGRPPPKLSPLEQLFGLKKPPETDDG